jgi:IS1 family transposase
VVKERTLETLQPLVDRVFSLVPTVHQFYSDGFSTYPELVYRQGKRLAQHDVAPGKEQTYTVEGTNADLRCYVPALDRKGRCFPRHIDKFRSTVRLFITCYNHCCLARLKYPKRTCHPSDFLPQLF